MTMFMNFFGGDDIAFSVPSTDSGTTRYFRSFHRLSKPASGEGSISAPRTCKAEESAQLSLITWPDTTSVACGDSPSLLVCAQPLTSGHWLGPGSLKAASPGIT